MLASEAVMLVSLFDRPPLQLGFFQRQKRRDEDEQKVNGKVAEER